MRTVAIVAMAILAALSLAAPVLAAGASGKVVSIEGEKVTIQVAKGDGAGFPVGTKGIEIRNDEGVSLRAKVVASSGDKITLRIVKGKASSLAVGASVGLEKARKAAGSEEMQGC